MDLDRLKEYGLYICNYFKTWDKDTNIFCITCEFYPIYSIPFKFLSENLITLNLPFSQKGIEHLQYHLPVAFIKLILYLIMW